ncbi:Inner membrane transporter rhtA [Pragia fontium]|uniref:threonine/homoserine exporter RhtA n=1 Tax=Pragia fontium TaxID=82985 RepID=UPI000E079037|nr:threonine/homoserine exporter RhtA [Pragia fontium]SUB81909.1 Inner membrane transporter rhtA [Pragia fontium]
MFLKEKKTSVLLLVILLLIAMLSIQSGASLAKSLFPIVGAQGMTALRLFLGTIILMIFLRPWRKSKTRLPAPGARWWLLAYGLSLGGMNLLFYMSLRTVPLGIAVALEFIGPLAVAMFSSRRLVDFLWVGLVIVGLGLLLPLNQSVNGVDPVGACYALGAGVFWALYIVFGQRAGASYGTRSVALGALVATIIVLPVGVIYAGSDLFSLSILPVAIGVAILSTALPYSLEMVALTRLPAQTFGTLTSLEPAMGAFSGLIFLNETLSFMQWMGLLAVIVASMGASLTIKPKAKLESVKIDTESVR